MAPTAGAEDRAPESATVAREMAALAPHARLEIVPGAGHMLTLEQPERVNTLLLHWLTEVSA